VHHRFIKDGRSHIAKAARRVLGFGACSGVESTIGDAHPKRLTSSERRSREPVPKITELQVAS